MRTSEIFVSEAEVKNRRRRSFNYVEDDFWPITMLTKIAAVRSKNEFLEVPLCLDKLPFFPYYPLVINIVRWYYLPHLQ